MHNIACNVRIETQPLREAVFGCQHSNVAIDFNNLGLVWYNLGDPKKAIGYYHDALAIDEAEFGRRHPKIA